MPSSIDIPLSGAAEDAAEAPMAFRRERYWFLSFLMTPFRDIDNRVAEDAASVRPAKRRSR